MRQSFKSVALPREHGAWGYVLEPFVLVLGIAFSLPGLYLLLAAFLFFLAHRPVSLVFRPQSHSENYPLAVAAALLYVSVGVLILYFTYPLLPRWSVILFSAGVLVMVLYLLFDIYKRKRSLMAEQVVPLALALMAIAVPVTVDWPVERVVALFFLLLVRPVPTTFYIHTRLKMEKGLEYSAGMVYLSHLTALIYTLGAAVTGWVPLSAILAAAILFFRAVKGISSGRRRLSVKELGLREFAFGAVFTGVVMAGYLLEM